MIDLHWLPVIPDWRQRLRRSEEDSTSHWSDWVALANARLSFVFTNVLDETVRRIFSGPPSASVTNSVRLAVLASNTLTHLLPAIRVAGMRRGIWVDTYENNFGQYLQELSNPLSALHDFKPSAVLLALDAHHVTAGVNAGLDAVVVDATLVELVTHIRETWRSAQRALKCPVLQQAVLPLHTPMVGNNEHRLPGSRAWFVKRLNTMLRAAADEDGVDILAVDDCAARDGLLKWHDAGLWHHSKQEVAPPAAPLYGELVGRWLAAKQGRSYKCLVLDLDNTLWGGVISDDGVGGITLGQGSALGEAYVAFQYYARELARRGVILAVCSKNDAEQAREPFCQHPDMVLQLADIACFVANWSDKVTNLRSIAQQLNIGLDSLVFVDDNPFERHLVREELPMVAVPELSDDPISYPLALADAGYFEALSITVEDRQRKAQYQHNQAREALKGSATDLERYLLSLEMRLIVTPFDRIGLQRIVQLINKSNQFNLTARRYTDGDVLAVMADANAVGLQLRLVDRLGDNGVIAIIVGRLERQTDFRIDTWVMSCRVLGRQVEIATLNVIAANALRLGTITAIGEYIPTSRNGMVKDHYDKLGFASIRSDPDGSRLYALDLWHYKPSTTIIKVEEG